MLLWGCWLGGRYWLCSHLITWTGKTWLSDFFFLLRLMCVWRKVSMPRKETLWSFILSLTLLTVTVLPRTTYQLEESFIFYKALILYNTFILIFYDTVILIWDDALIPCLGSTNLEQEGVVAERKKQSKLCTSFHEERWQQCKFNVCKILISS